MQRTYDNQENAEKRIKDCESRIEELSKIINSSNQIKTSFFSKPFIDKSREVVSRTSKLICGNLPESVVTGDTDLLNKICEVIGFDKSCIISSHRLGKPHPSKFVWLMKIQFISDPAAQLFLSLVIKT